MSDQKDKIEITYVPHEDDSEDKEIKKTEPQKSSPAQKKVSPKKIQEKFKKQDEIIKLVVKERDEFKDKYLRSLAEVDNFRKRVNKEKEDFQKFMLAEFLLNLMPIFDNLERALNSKTATNENETSIISGVEMIYKQMLDLFKKYNVVEIEALHKPFDPNFHQALSKVEKKDLKEPVIIEVYQKGFLYNNKLLRPTLAKVAIPAKTDETDSEEL
jgi:molecular chaperone GrpE